MQTTTFSRLRNNAKKYFDAVEGGETIEIYRNGKPVALLSPFKKGRGLRWASAKPIKLSGISLSLAILDERREDR